MAKRARDILLNIDSGDVVLSSANEQVLNYKEIIWGTLFDDDDGSVLYANIYIPSGEVNSLKADSVGRYKIYFHTTYQSVAKSFQIRLVTKVDQSYSKISQASCRYPVVSVAYLPGGSGLTVNASELLFINMDGYYVADLVFGTGVNNAFIYSAGNVDLGVGASDEQVAQLLSLCAPGKYYRYPLTGVDITKYINTVVGYTDFSKRISEEFRKDGIDADSIDFDSDTGKIDVVFKHEGENNASETLVNVDNLDADVIDITDSLISTVGQDISLDDLDVDYDSLVFEMDIPSAILESCFANGIWMGSYPWTGAELWKGQE